MHWMPQKPQKPQEIPLYLSFQDDLSYQLLQIVPEKLLHLVKWNHLHPVVQIGVYGVRNDQQFFVIACQFLKSNPAKITGVRLFSVNHQYSAADFLIITENRLIQKGHTADFIPAPLEFRERA